MKTDYMFGLLKHPQILSVTSQTALSVYKCPIMLLGCCNQEQELEGVQTRVRGYVQSPSKCPVTFLVRIEDIFRVE